MTVFATRSKLKSMTVLSMEIRLAGIVNDSITDGPGLRLAVFAQGCRHACPNCHNPHTHDPLGGYLSTVEELLAVIDKNPLLDGITLTGGEPFLQADSLFVLAKEARNRGLSVGAYSGFTWEELRNTESSLKLLTILDFLIDGRYIHELRTFSLPFRGSSNQRVIDVHKSLEQNTVVEYTVL